MAEWKPIPAGAGPGLQTRRAALCVTGGFDPHWLPPIEPVKNRMIALDRAFSYCNNHIRQTER
jgi:hypothetical protein